MRKSKAAVRPKSKIPVDQLCPSCSGALVRRSAELRLPVHGEEIAVPKVAHLHCKKCGENVLDVAESRELQMRAIDAYRAKHGLLTAPEIRSIRENHGLSQVELAELLKLGEVTLSRWESGRFVQSSSMDVLLRLIRDVPSTLDYLRKRAA